MSPLVRLDRRGLYSENKGGSVVEDSPKLVFLPIEDGIEDPKADMELCEVEPPLDKDIGVGGKP